MLHHTRSEILYHSICGPNQIKDNVPALGTLQVDNNAFLVSVGREKISAEPVLIGWGVPRVIAYFFLFDLYDLESQITKYHGAERAGQHSSMVNNPCHFSSPGSRSAMPLKLK